MGQSRAGRSTRRVEGFDIFDAGIRSVWRRPAVQKGIWVEGMERPAWCRDEQGSADNRHELPHHWGFTRHA